MTAAHSLAAEGSPLATPRLRQARFEDYAAIARLGAKLSLKDPPFHEWASIWLDNPLWHRVGKRWPIGWVLETADGEIVGAETNFPTRFTFRGQEVVCGNGRGWGVLDGYRGYALALMDEYLNQPNVDVFVNTTVNPQAAPLIERVFHRVPLGDWATASYWVTGHKEYARDRMRSRNALLAKLLAIPIGAALRLKDVVNDKPLPKARADVLIDTVDRFDQRFDTFWNELVRQNREKLLSDRSSSALSWHFALPMKRRQITILTASRNGRLRAYCILNRRGGGRRMHLVDYQSIEHDVDLLPGLIAAALRRCPPHDVCVLQNLGRGVPKMQAFDVYAPYHVKLPCWRYYYSAADDAVGAALDDPHIWDPSAYDGDESLV